MTDSSPMKTERQSSLLDIEKLRTRLNEKRKVLLADSVSQSVIDALSPVCEVTMNSKLQDESLEAELKKLNPMILVVRSTIVTRAHILAAPKLGLIIRAGAGFNTIDVNLLYFVFFLRVFYLFPNVCMFYVMVHAMTTCLFFSKKNMYVLSFFCQKYVTCFFFRKFAIVF